MNMLAEQYTPEHAGEVALDGAIAKNEDRTIDHLYEKCKVVSLLPTV
jgi:hypothetical protein